MKGTIENSELSCSVLPPFRSVKSQDHLHLHQLEVDSVSCTRPHHNHDRLSLNIEAFITLHPHLCICYTYQMSPREPHKRHYRLMRLLRLCLFSHESETKHRSASPKVDAKHQPASPELLTRHRSTSYKHLPASPKLFQTQSHHEPGVSKQVPRLRIITATDERPKEPDLPKTLPWINQSLLLLPTEEPTIVLRVPSCICATADFLARHTTTPGLFRDPGSPEAVEALLNYYCRAEDSGTYIRDMVPFPCLPEHIPVEIHDVATTFKQLVAMIPGGILGSLALFDLIAAIDRQKIAGQTKTFDSARALGIASALRQLESPTRRNTIRAVFGLLNLIGNAAEREGALLPSSDLMSYKALSLVFGPLLVSETLDPCCKWKFDSAKSNDITEMLITYWPHVAQAMFILRRPRFNLDQKQGREAVIHGRKSSRHGQQNKSSKPGQPMFAGKNSRKESLRSKSLATTLKPKATSPQGRDSYKSLHSVPLSDKPKLRATPRQDRPGEKRRQEMGESVNNSPLTPSRSQGSAPTFGHAARGHSYCPPRPVAAEAEGVHQEDGHDSMEMEELRRVSLLMKLNADIANRSKLQRLRGSGTSIPRPDPPSVDRHSSSPLSPILSTVLPRDSESTKIDEPNLRRSRSLGSLIFEPSHLDLDLHPAPSKKPERETTDDAKLRSPSSLGTMVPHPELPPVAQHLNFTRPSSATNMQPKKHTRFLTPDTTPPTSRPGSTTYLHTQIRHVQHQLQSKTEEVLQLKRQLEAHDHTEVGTLSQQLREGRREIQMTRDRAEAAERRVKVFERFTARLSGMKVEHP